MNENERKMMDLLSLRLTDRQRRRILGISWTSYRYRLGNLRSKLGQPLARQCGGAQAKLRFELSLKTDYRLLWEGQEVAGRAVTINISSSSLLMRADRELPVGQRVRLKLDWPATLDNRRLAMVLDGQVMRTAGPQAEVEIHKYDFVVRAKSSAVSAAA